MPNDKELINLYTVEATLKYDELPKTLKLTWSPSWGLSDESDELSKRGLDHHNADYLDQVYVSINGRLQKKCIFIKDIISAIWFRDYLQLKLEKVYPSIKVNAKRIERHHLDYRCKKAMSEARENSLKIQDLMRII